MDWEANQLEELYDAWYCDHRTCPAPGCGGSLRLQRATSRAIGELPVECTGCGRQHTLMGAKDPLRGRFQEYWNRTREWDTDRRFDPAHSKQIADALPKGVPTCPLCNAILMNVIDQPEWTQVDCRRCLTRALVPHAE